ncbi:MAG: hypothetical protein QOJ65_2249 [Fimbriimonadaceae bacterium]|nr:hypothetical protein [Fimbriimonadaceae bacterium]
MLPAVKRPPIAEAVRLAGEGSFSLDMSTNQVEQSLAPLSNADLGMMRGMGGGLTGAGSDDAPPSTKPPHEPKTEFLCVCVVGGLVFGLLGVASLLQGRLAAGIALIGCAFVLLGIGIYVAARKEPPPSPKTTGPALGAAGAGVQARETPREKEDKPTDAWSGVPSSLDIVLLQKLWLRTYHRCRLVSLTP